MTGMPTSSGSAHMAHTRHHAGGRQFATRRPNSQLAATFSTITAPLATRPAIQWRLLVSLLKGDVPGTTGAMS